MFRPAFLLLTALPLSAGCAQKGAFPSLKPRAAEQLSTDEPVRAAPVVAVNADLGAQLANLIGEARRGHAEFEAALPPARSAVGQAGASGSESWVAAQQALSRLEAARARTVTALAELDRLALVRAGQPTDAGQYQELLTAVETAASLAGGQQAQIDRLRRSLSPT